MSYLGLEEAERALKLGAYHQAYEIFVAMVEGGEDPAYFKLCEMAINGQLNEDLAADFVERLEMAVRSDNESATYNLAVLHSRGAILSRDIPKAAELFSKACRWRVPEAFAALVRLCLHHKDVLGQADPGVISKLLDQGIKLGASDSAYLLGRLYMTGELFRADPFQAVKYLYAAARLGEEEAKKALAVIQSMNPGANFDRQQKEGTDLYWRMKNPDLHAESRDEHR